MNKQSRRDRGSRAKQVREAAGLSQTDFAGLVGCSRQAIGAIENGGNMSVDQLVEYVVHGRSTAQSILFGVPEGSPPEDAEVAKQFARLDPWLRERLWPLYQVFVRRGVAKREKSPS